MSTTPTQPTVVEPAGSERLLCPFCGRGIESRQGRTLGHQAGSGDSVRSALLAMSGGYPSTPGAAAEPPVNLSLP
jgi:hypothetical protein